MLLRNHCDREHNRRRGAGRSETDAFRVASCGQGCSAERASLINTLRHDNHACIGHRYGRPIVPRIEIEFEVIPNLHAERLSVIHDRRFIRCGRRRRKLNGQ